jgi:hypothetical protein
MGSFEDVRAWAQALAAANHLTPVTVPPSLTHPPALQLDPELAAQIEKARAEKAARQRAWDTATRLDNPSLAYVNRINKPTNEDDKDAEITALEEAVKALQIKVARLQAEENEARG